MGDILVMFSCGVVAISTRDTKILSTIDKATSKDVGVISSKGVEVDCINGGACRSNMSSLVLSSHKIR